MGPTTLFDKSFLQSLNVDESVWFDHHFSPVISPIFYVETLADLAKPTTERGPAEKEVRVIASKFPEMSGTPCANHIDLVISELMGGQRAPMTGQVPVAGGRNVRSGDREGVVIETSPEANAFSRWLEEKFLDVERQHAREWREQLKSLNIGEIAKSFQTLGIDGSNLKTFEEAKVAAQQIVSSSDNPFERLRLAVIFLGVPRELHQPIIKRWVAMGKPTLTRYAPYAAFVLTVEIFFQLAITANLISSERQSNRTDIAYLFYLPFCHFFVSGDKLHKKCVPLFLRSDQTFVWGPALKADLTRLNAHYSELSEEEKEKGLFAIADKPPVDGGFLVTQLWNTHAPGWHTKGERVEIKDPETERKIAKDLAAFSKAPSLSPSEAMVGQDDSKFTLSIARKMHKRKGSWWQLPKSLEAKDE